MNRVGIITFHNAENYGAALQTYGLMKAVQKFGFDCSVIDYRNRGVFYRNAIKNFYYLVTGQNPIKNHLAYRRFQHHYLNLTKKPTKRASDLEAAADEFDFLLFGSDQIWNPDLSNGFDPVYFGQFKTSATKIAYAASIGKDTLSTQEIQKINQLITRFDAISVREETMLPFIHREVECVLDPCMLIPAPEWGSIATKTIPNKDFILVYQLHPNKVIVKTAVNIAQTMGKKVLLISPYLVLKDRNILQKLGRITPTDFLGYFHQADIVLSDSLHGTIFSILFNKLFYTILPAEKRGRITSLLGKLGLSDRIVNQEDITPIPIDYSEVTPLLKIEIDKSMDFLRRNLQE